MDVNLDKDDFLVLFRHFDYDNSGTIDFEEFIQGVRDPLNARRRALVDMAFDRLDTDGNGVIDDNEIQDERIAWVKQVPDGTYAGGLTRNNGIGRALCIGTDGNLWVGLYNNYEYYKISSVDGHTIAGPVATSYPSYGCLIDQNGTLRLRLRSLKL